MQVSILPHWNCTHYRVAKLKHGPMVRLSPCATTNAKVRRMPSWNFSQSVCGVFHSTNDEDLSFFFFFVLLLFTCRPLLLTANYTNDFRILGRFSFLRLHNSCRNRHIWEGCKISKVNNTDFWRRFSSPSSVFTYITSTSRTKQSFCKDTLFEATHQDELALPHFHWQYIFRSSSTHCGS